VTAIYIGGLLPPASFWRDQEAYQTILGFVPRILVASFTAYLIGEFANSFVLAKMKIATQGRWLWARTISSTVVGEGLDSFVFITIAFLGIIPAAGLASAIISQWLTKTLYETIATPVTYLVVNYLKNKEGIDSFDTKTKFNPLVFSE
jgi:uncharacterized integral membrane protein (TIGR00697 family)